MENLASTVIVSCQCAIWWFWLRVVTDMFKNAANSTLLDVCLGLWLQGVQSVLVC